ncbi:carboxymuconolactone decarboxylase family protein [Psychroserpens jangbogonensis]|uniref:carboxymuconolactone decarboxylase family protein n=1 Tax=Psychroserpens jangbogonensis TaxID=1484460 RepID=UPI00068DB7DD|nr:carboxymuconolactone decarboxylase family protein [Psychroserpens jangbogonensis]
MNSTLEIRHLELVRLRIGYLNNCNYSINLHLNELKNFGETDLRLSLVSVWNLVPYFSEKERALFALTDYILNSNNSKNYEQVYMLLKRHFDNTQISALTQAIEQIDLWTRSLKHTESLSSFKKQPN